MRVVFFRTRTSECSASIDTPEQASRILDAEKREACAILGVDAATERRPTRELWVEVDARTVKRSG